MVIVAFSNKTSKILPRILCGNLKHVAPICLNGDTMCMHQFIAPKNIAKIYLKKRDIQILIQHGWQFISLANTIPNHSQDVRAITCVQFTKQIIGLTNWRIQTPGSLFKHLNKNPQ